VSDQGFAGLRVLALESRRSAEMARLIENSGGIPTVAPSMREVPLESNTEALEFARVLLEGEFHVVIFLTGVGTRTLARAVETAYPREKFAEALRRVAVVARGPKPIAALKELGVTPGAKFLRCWMQRETRYHFKGGVSRCRSTEYQIPSCWRDWPGAAQP